MSVKTRILTDTKRIYNNKKAFGDLDIPDEAEKLRMSASSRNSKNAETETSKMLSSIPMPLDKGGEARVAAASSVSRRLMRIERGPRLRPSRPGADKARGTPSKGSQAATAQFPAETEPRHSLLEREIGKTIVRCNDFQYGDYVYKGLKHSSDLLSCLSLGLSSRSYPHVTCELKTGAVWWGQEEEEGKSIWARMIRLPHTAVLLHESYLVAPASRRSFTMVE